MRRGALRGVLVSTLAVAITLLLGEAAMAVSGGGYRPSQQDCPANADSTAQPNKTTVPGCHNFKLNVEDGKGRRYAELGLDQLPQGYSSFGGLFSVGDPTQPNFPHAGCAAVNTNGTGGAMGNECGAGTSAPGSCAVSSPSGGAGAVVVFDTQNQGNNCIKPQTGSSMGGLDSLLQNGLVLYLGADDNLDAGEHDGVTGAPANGTAGSVNGPSDGGAVTAHVTPSRATTAPSGANPFPAAGASENSCADGLCQEVTTHRQSIYQGCGANPYVTPSGGCQRRSRDAANYGGKRWDPYNCSSGDVQSERPGPNGCGSQTMDQWRSQEAENVYAEPGAQVYEDPDPQGSPIDPLHDGGVTSGTPLYPIPSAYAGTCGVVAGGGPVASAPAGTPGTNSAGQVVVSSGAC